MLQSRSHPGCKLPFNRGDVPDLVLLVQDKFLRDVVCEQVVIVISPRCIAAFIVVDITNLTINTHWLCGPALSGRLSGRFNFCRTLAKTFSMYQVLEISRLLWFNFTSVSWFCTSLALVSWYLKADSSLASTSRYLEKECHLSATLKNLTQSFRFCLVLISQC